MRPPYKLIFAQGHVFRCLRRTGPAAIRILADVAFFSASAGAQTVFTPQGEQMVINAPDEVDLQVMADFVGQSLEIRFLYGEELTGKKVQLRPSPITVPKAKLLELLATLLRVRDLVMVEESPGLYRILPAESAARSTLTVLPADLEADPSSLRIVTQGVRAPAERIEDLAEKLSRFTSAPKGNVLAVPEQGLLLITDYEGRLAVLQDLLTLLSSEVAAVEVRMLEVSGDPKIMAPQLSAMVEEAHRVGQLTGNPPSIRGDLVPRALVVTSRPEQRAMIEKLVESLNPPARDWISRTYDLKYIEAHDAEQLIENVALGPGSHLPRPAQLYADAERSRLHVTAEEATHRAIARVLTENDQAVSETQRPLRTYRPIHRPVGELLTALVQLLGEGPTLTAVEGPNSAEVKNQGGEVGLSGRGTGTQQQLPPTPPQSSPPSPALPGSTLRVEGPDYVLTADEPTNTLLAVGPREFHVQLALLLDELDRRRAQVLIEMKLLAVTSSDSLNLGIELTQFDAGDAWDYLTFSAFGLSTIDTNTGQRVLTPGVGANGILLSPDEEAFIIQALATQAKARILSSPKILVADNARGVLRNVDEAPFTSVNASDTVATTSFAGFESAGTTLSVTPHILDEEKLTLEYELSFSNFAGASSEATVPPPRTTNSFTSTVEVPDGYSVVTGGLMVDNTSDSLSEVPLLGRIPGLGLLFQNTARQATQTRVYAFIRPVILKEDRFEDLKYLSLKEVQSAELPVDGAPASEALWME